MITIGTKIKKIRELKDYTQEYMAHSLGISPTAYGRIERDETEINFSKLDQVAKVLGVDARQILDFDEKYYFNIHENNSSVGNNNTVYHNDKMIEHLLTEITHLRVENAKLIELLIKKGD